MSDYLLISEVFPPRHGGSGRWFYELYRRLPQESVWIVTQINEPIDDDRVDKNFPQKILRIPLSSEHWGIFNVWGAMFYLVSFYRILRFRLSKVKQIHCGRVLHEGVIGMLFASLHRKPLLCFVHGEDIEVARTSRELSWLVQKVLARSTLLVCNSRNTQELLIKHWNVGREKIAVIHPGVDEEKFTIAGEDREFRLRRYWNDRFVCLTVGRLQKRKGHDKMIEAIPSILKDIPDFLYVIVGNGENYESLIKLRDSLGVGDHVQFLMEIDDKELINCYQQCDLFVLPNRADGNDIEGFGMVLAEAQACGKPVIAGDSGGTREAFLPETTGKLVDCTFTDTISKAVVTMKHEIEEGYFDKKVCRDHVLSSLTWSQHARKAITEFSKLNR
jgi:phosphatidyl-myo-inositol dimannoside synthase